MRQDVRDVIARRRVPFWSRASVWAGAIVLSWIVFLIFFAGIAWWLEVLAEALA